MRTDKTFQDVYEISYIRDLFPPRIVEELIMYNYTPVKEATKAESVFIYGDVETGKTLYAASLLIQHKKYCYYNQITSYCLFAPFSNMLREIRLAYSDKTVSEKELLNKYVNVDVLLIDDFLTTKITDWVYDTLYYIINERYENLKTTIITSNFSLDEIEKILQDQRITRRINRMCKVVNKQTYKTTIVN